MFIPFPSATTKPLRDGAGGRIYKGFFARGGGLAGRRRDKKALSPATSLRSIAPVLSVDRATAPSRGDAVRTGPSDPSRLYFFSVVRYFFSWVMCHFLQQEE